MIYDKLYDWQKNIVDMYKDKSAFGIWLDMGLGKTPISLAFAEINNCTKILIIGLNNKVSESKDVNGSFLNWMQDYKYSLDIKYKYSSEFDSNNECMLVNYESLYERGKNKCDKERVTLKHSIVQFIETCKGQNVAIIVDESHALKNLQTTQTVAVTKIKKLLERIANKVYTYLLTGTPFTKGYVDMYSQLKLLGCPMTKTQFVDEFCIKGNMPGLLGWQQPIVGYKNVDKLFDLVHEYAITAESDVFIKRPKPVVIDYITKRSAVFNALTTKQLKASTVVKYCDMLGVDSTKYKEYKDILIQNPFYRNIAYPDLKWLAETSGTFWLRARELSIGFQGNKDEAKWYDRSRLDMLEEFLADCPDNYVLFYQYTPELLEIYSICEKLGYNIDVYCGECKSLVNYENYAKLNESEKLTHRKNIIISNYTSGGTGKNWQEYNKLILFDIPVYKDYRQSIKRLDRTGQEKQVIIFRFYQNNWLDANMYKAIDEGIDYSSDLFNADISRMNELTK